MIEDFGVNSFDITHYGKDAALVAGGLARVSSVATFVDRHCGDFQVCGTPMAVQVARRGEPVYYLTIVQKVHVAMACSDAVLRDLAVCEVESVPAVDSVAVLAEKIWSRRDDAQEEIHVFRKARSRLHHAGEVSERPHLQSTRIGVKDSVAVRESANCATGTHSGAQLPQPPVVRAEHLHAHAPDCITCRRNWPNGAVIGVGDVAGLKFAARTSTRRTRLMRILRINARQLDPNPSAVAPSDREIDGASEPLANAKAAWWAPMYFKGRLHDLESCDFCWQILERADGIGRSLPSAVHHYLAAY